MCKFMLFFSQLHKKNQNVNNRKKPCLFFLSFSFRGHKKKEKPPRTLITTEGKVLNINEPKYVRKNNSE